MAVMIIAVAVGTAVAASLLALSLDISSKIAVELRSYGANIIVQPKVSSLANISGQKRYLDEGDVVKAKTIFWRHNIMGVVPFLLVRDDVLGVTIAGTWFKKNLAVPGEKIGFDTGASIVMPWWSLDGRWPSTESEIVAGIGFARSRGVKIGDRVTVIGGQYSIAGIIDTGGREDEMLIGELATVQRAAGLQGKVSQVFVSALTTPMDEFAYKDPAAMSKKEYEKWYCTAYVTSIAKQLEEAFNGSTVKPIWPVAETEGKVLHRLELLIGLLTVVSLCAAALGVSTTMIMSLLRRTREVALMKAIGADSRQTAMIFLAEALFIGAVGGIAGYLMSLGVSSYLGRQVFGAGLQQRGVLFPISMGIAIAIAVLGAFLPVKRALSIKSAIVLKGGQ